MKTLKLWLVLLAIFCIGNVFATSNEEPIDCNKTPGPGVRINWSNCNKIGLHLENANLESAILNETLFNASTMVKTNFKNAQLIGADLYQANWEKVDLQGAKFRGVRLNSTCLKGADLRGTDLTGTKLLKSYPGDQFCADFSEANLSGAIWIDGVTKCKEGSIGNCNGVHSDCTAICRVRWP
jgi:hypothetical protein